MPAGTVAGAVNTPPWVTEPHPEVSWTDQTTETSEVPETVAVKVAVPPGGTVAVDGDTLIVITSGVEFAGASWQAGRPARRTEAKASGQALRRVTVSMIEFPLARVRGCTRVATG